MPIDFPTGPTTGQVYTYLGKSWIWNGTGWDVATPSFLPPFAAGNVIINGAFDIWQRGTSFTYAGGAQNYVCDRWQGWATAAGTNLSISRQAGTANLQYAARFQRVAGNTSTASLVFAQTIETANSIPLAGQTVTLSFYARKGADFSPTLGNLTVSILSGTGTDQNHTAFTGAATVVSEVISLTGLWVQYKVTGAVSASATQLGIRVNMVPSGTAGANDWFEITGVQLEAGAVATPFKRNAPSIQAEFAACQRYYETSYDIDIVPGTVNEVQASWSTVNAADTTLVNGTTFFKVPKRVYPTITIYNTSTGATNSLVAGGTTFTVSVPVYTKNFINRIYTTSAMTPNMYVRYSWAASAEL
jgi:hypothetical protein